MSSSLQDKLEWGNRDDFFSDVMGMRESQFWNFSMEDRAKYFDPESMKLKTKEGVFDCGFLHVYNLGDLIKRSEDKMKKIKSANNGTFSVWEGIDTFADCHMRTYKILDCGAMQGSSEFAGAVFDVASNFNALETTNPQSEITAKYCLLENYVRDKTQGPFCSISAAPGLIFRRYFVNCKKYPNDFDKWEQKAILPEYQKSGECLNLLDEITGEENSPLTMSKGGYVTFKKDYLPKEEYYGKIKIAFHLDTQVTFGSVNGRKHQRVKKKQLISQSFSAAPDLGYVSGGYNLMLLQNQRELVINWAKFIINASREGILRAAYLHNKKKVVLTMIGCGVFSCNTQWIADAIERMLDFIVKSGLEVILVWFDSRGRDDGYRKRLMKMVNNSHGEYRQYCAGKPKIL